MNPEQKKAYKILIVEDEKEIREGIEANIKKLGYSISGVANSYEKAIESAKQDFPHIALCDFQLFDHKDGADVANQLRKMGNLSIVYLTQFSQDTIKRKILQTNPSGYLLKGEYTPETLDIHIQLAIQQYHKAGQDPLLNIKEGKLFVWDRGRYHVVKIDDILYLEADGDNTIFFTVKKLIDSNQGFGKVVTGLKNTSIQRVGRSHAVNLDKIDNFDNRASFVVLDTSGVSKHVTSYVGFNSTISVTQAYRDKLKNIFLG